jgi:membrane protein DedA with SNARE-associated domain
VPVDTFRVASQDPEGRSPIEQLIVHYGVVIVVLMVFVGELGVPTGMPVEVALLIAGAFAIHTLPGLALGLIAVMLADIAGTVTLHLVARTGGIRLLTHLLRRHEERSREFLERWREKFGGHDVVIVFVGRLFPIARSYVAVGTGLLRIPFRDYVVGAAPASLLWAGLPLGAGYVFRAHVFSIAEQYTRFEHIAFIVVPVLVVIGVIAWWVHRGGSLRGRVWRARSSVAIVVAIGVIIYMIQSAWVNSTAVERGVVALPWPLLWSWLAILASIAIGLLLVAVSDLRLARKHAKERRIQLPQLVRTELMTTIVWLSLIITAGAVMIEIELRYPSL